MAKKSIQTGKLDIKYEMTQFDKKSKTFYSDLTDEERKKFSTYLMIRYGASVFGSSDLQAYYLMATNENLNKWFFDLYKHPKLQWLCASTVSPGIGVVSHYWLSAKNKNKQNNALKAAVLKQMPMAKEQDIELFMKLNSEEDIKSWLLDFGIEFDK